MTITVLYTVTIPSNRYFSYDESITQTTLSPAYSLFPKRLKEHPLNPCSFPLQKTSR